MKTAKHSYSVRVLSSVTVIAKSDTRNKEYVKENKVGAVTFWVRYFFRVLVFKDRDFL